MHDVTERVVVGEEADDDGIAEDGAGTAPPVDGEVDDGGDERITRPLREGSFSATSTTASSLFSSDSAAARTISSFVLYWW